MTLIASAYRHQDRLPPLLREDVRRAAGWTVRREELLADTSAPRVTAPMDRRRQPVRGPARQVAPPGDLARQRSARWCRSARRRADRLCAGSAGGFGFPFEPGERLDGEVVFYPSAAPLRGLLATRKQTTSTAPWPRSHDGLAAGARGVRGPPRRVALARSLAAACRQRRNPTAGKGQLAIADAAGNVLPLDRGQSETLMPMVGLGPISVLFNWDGRLARLVAADTPLGTWHEG